MGQEPVQIWVITICNLIYFLQKFKLYLEFYTLMALECNTLKFLEF